MNNEDQDKDKEHERHKKLNGDGSPITVGGGGGIDRDKDKDMNKDTGDVPLTEGNLSCTFDEGQYPDPSPGNDDKKFFKRSDSRIQTLKIRTFRGVDDRSSELPADGKCEIKVHATGTKDDVTFISQDAGNGTMEFGIEMDTRRYKGRSHTADQPSHINKIDLNGKKLAEFSLVDECAICVDYVTPDKSKCFTKAAALPPGD